MLRIIEKTEINEVLGKKKWYESILHKTFSIVMCYFVPIREDANMPHQ